MAAEQIELPVTEDVVESELMGRARRLRRAIEQAVHNYHAARRANHNLNGGNITIIQLADQIVFAIKNASDFYHRYATEDGVAANVALEAGILGMAEHLMSMNEYLGQHRKAIEEVRFTYFRHQRPHDIFHYTDVYRLYGPTAMPFAWGALGLSVVTIVTLSYVALQYRSRS